MNFNMGDDELPADEANLTNWLPGTSRLLFESIVDN